MALLESGIRNLKTDIFVVQILTHDNDVKGTFRNLSFDFFI